MDFRRLSLFLIVPLLFVSANDALAAKKRRRPPPCDFSSLFAGPTMQRNASQVLDVTDKSSSKSDDDSADGDKPGSSARGNKLAKAAEEVVQGCWPIANFKGGGNSCSVFPKLGKVPMEAYSKGLCATGVSKALAKVGIRVSGNAYDMHKSGALKKAGMNDVTSKYIKNTSPKSLDTQNLPKGAVVVYKSLMKKNAYGHIEIYTGKKFCSDFCSGHALTDVYGPSPYEIAAIYIVPEGK